MSGFKAIPLALRRLRTSRGLTQAALAEVVDTNRTTVNLWETGRVEPRLDNVSAVLEALGCDIFDLYRAIEAVEERQLEPETPVTLEPAERERLLIELAGLGHLPRARQRLFLNALESLRKLVEHVASLPR